ncbi:hypothetical protein [Fluviicola sp.]|uniref:hypothetical protein n=1 Tax=Fluviicola sp. TaxID=1917219 RepID=UPI003D2E260D
MELDQLKTDWKTTPIPDRTEEQIKLMILENRHPVLRKIRKQLTIELIGWSVFLFCYYTMFDGDQKPLSINVLLVISVLISFVHNTLGYTFSKHLVRSENLVNSLTRYLGKLKQYALISLISRVVFSAGLLTFLSYNIHFTQSKYLLLGAIIGAFMIQLVALHFIWLKRLKKIRSSVQQMIQV